MKILVPTKLYFVFQLTSVYVFMTSTKCVERNGQVFEFVIDWTVLSINYFQKVQ